MSLSPSELEDFLGVLSQIPLSVDLDSVSRTLAPKIKSQAIKDGEKALEVLISLSATKAHASGSTEDFIQQILQTLEESESDRQVSENGRGHRARENLTKLLTYEPLSVVTKAYHVLHDQERTAAGVRILTDVRPVFGDDVGSPSAVLINHVLKLSYFKDGRPLDFYLALDEEHMGELKRAIERAEQKAEVLKKVFSSPRIPIVQS